MKKENWNPPLLLLPCFSFLSPYNFISIFDTLSFVWFWGSPLPNWSSKLANLRFVIPTNCDSGVFLHLHFEAIRDYHLNRMRKSKIQHDFVSFYHSTITNTNKLKFLVKTFRYSNHQVVCKCPDNIYLQTTWESSMNTDKWNIIRFHIFMNPNCEALLKLPKVKLIILLVQKKTFIHEMEWWWWWWWWSL